MSESMASAAAGSEGAGGAARPPAVAYVGLVIMTLVVTLTISSMAQAVIQYVPVALSMRGMSNTQLSYVVTTISLAVWFISVIAVLITAYFGARGSMRWHTFLMTFHGRATRAQYWLWYWLPFFALSAIAVVLVVAASIAPFAMFSDVLGGGYEDWAGAVTANMWIFAVRLDLLLLWPALAVVVKRLHDRGKSGWFLLIVLIPIIGSIWLFIEVALLPGKREANKHGPDPLARAV